MPRTPSHGPSALAFDLKVLGRLLHRVETDEGMNKAAKEEATKLVRRLTELLASSVSSNGAVRGVRRT